MPPLVCESGGSSASCSSSEESAAPVYASEHSEPHAARRDEGYEVSPTSHHQVSLHTLHCLQYLMRALKLSCPCCFNLFNCLIIKIYLKIIANSNTLDLIAVEILLFAGRRRDWQVRLTSVLQEQENIVNVFHSFIRYDTFYQSLS